MRVCVYVLVCVALGSLGGSSASYQQIGVLNLVRTSSKVYQLSVLELIYAIAI